VSSTSPPSTSPPTARDRDGGYVRSLRACAVWAALNLLVILAAFGPPPSAGAAAGVLGALVLSVVLGAVAVRLVTRARPAAWPFWQLLALALPFFLVVRLVLG
jgi:hypothetical protein